MKLFAFLFLLVGALISVVESQAIPAGCTNITIPVTVTAENLALPPNLNIQNLLTILEPLIGTILDSIVSGTFNIAATYCEPVKTNMTLHNTLQLLVHGATYTKAYWFGEYYAQEYSWVHYASNAGYPTLTIDRLGNGASQHPDPILTVQDPMHVEILHSIIQLARTNQFVIPAPRSFDTIILAGHSLGSVISNVLNTKYPDDADVTVLTGYAPITPLNLIGLAVQAGLFPAALYDWRYQNLDLGYLEFENRVDFNFLFYYPGQFDHSIQNLDFNLRGTFSIGEAATAALPSQVAWGYANPLLVITGSHDSFFCSLFGLDLQILLGSPNCDTSSTGPAARTHTQLYPNVPARNFGLLQPNAGHCWHLHYSAYATFDQAHRWLASQGF